jgi:hypothetical protein
MVNFNFSYAPGISLQQMVGFETAGRVWSAYLTDSVTVNLHVGVSSSLPANVIGGALPGITSQTFVDLKAQMAADVTSIDDWFAIDGISARANKQDFKARFDLFDSKGKNNGTNATTRSLNLTRANAKSLGVALADGSTALDGVVVFGTLEGSAYTWSYDYTRTNPAPANSLDFLSTAIHEIGHVLGVVSGVDKPGWLDSSFNKDKKVQEAYKDFVSNSTTYTTPLDLFRYSANTLGTDLNDLSYGSRGGDKYFSIDGNTVIAQFSTGKDTSLGGSGEQASHWKQGTMGIMDPTLAPRARESITTIDLLALDVIGWNLAPNASNLSLNLSALLEQSQQGLAQRLGQTVTWLNANASTAAQNLARDRSQDIATMVKNSEVYDWGRPGNGNGSGNGSGSGGFGQIIDLLQNQAVYTSFEMLDDSALSATTSSSALSQAAKVKLAVASVQQLAARLEASGAKLPNLQFSSELSLGGVQAIAPGRTAPSPQRNPGRLKSLGAERTSSANPSRSQSAGHQPSPVWELSGAELGV